MSTDASAGRTTSSARAAPTLARYPRWVAAVVIVGALGVMSLAYAGLFSPSTLLAAGQHMNEAAKDWARYAAAYSASLESHCVPVALREVREVYWYGQTVVRALDWVSAEFTRQLFTAVMGPSGSGKNTLLHCAAPG